MKNIKLLLSSLALCLPSVSCTYDVPVDTSRGGHPVPIHHEGGGRPVYFPDQDGHFNSGRGYRPAYGGGNVIQHGDPRQHVYGNGVQTYVPNGPEAFRQPRITYQGF